MRQGARLNNPARLAGFLLVLGAVSACGDTDTARMRADGGGEVSRDMTGSVVQGRFAAQRWCSSCHNVDGDAPGVDAGAPSFTAIAGRPGVTSASLLEFMDETHPVYSVGAPIDMPTDVLYEREKADLVAYILSLNSDDG